MNWNGKNCQNVILGEKLAGNGQMDRIFMFMKKFGPRGLSAPARGYIHVCDHNVQTSSSLKPLGQSKPNFMWSIIRKGERKFV